MVSRRVLVPRMAAASRAISWSTSTDVLDMASKISRTTSVAERRARLAWRHHLCAEAPAADIVSLASRLVGLHATDPATVFLSGWARVPGLTVADVEKALYVDRSLVRHLGMRRTLFAVPTHLVPVVQGACTDAVAAVQRTRLVRDVETGGLATDGKRWLADVEKATLDTLRSLGTATGAELSRAVPSLQAKLTYAEGRTWGGQIGVATRVFTVMAAEGRIVRGKPNGSWTSSAHRWLPVDPEDRRPIGTADARAELARAWLSAFGPATVADFKWWSGLGLREVRSALAAAGAVEVDMDGGPGVVLADDIEAPAAPAPWAAVLPSLDATTMGWQQRAWYLGDHGKALFDTNGNAGPTLWWDGRIVGGWAQRPNGEVVARLLEDVGSDATSRIDAEVERLQRWLGTTRVMPRFPTPLQRGLAATG